MTPQTFVDCITCRFLLYEVPSGGARCHSLGTLLAATIITRLEVAISHQSESLDTINLFHLQPYWAWRTRRVARLWQAAEWLPPDSAIHVIVAEMRLNAARLQSAVCDWMAHEAPGAADGSSPSHVGHFAGIVLIVLQSAFDIPANWIPIMFQGWTDCRCRCCFAASKGGNNCNDNRSAQILMRLVRKIATVQQCQRRVMMGGGGHRQEPGMCDTDEQWLSNNPEYLPIWQPSGPTNARLKDLYQHP